MFQARSYFKSTTWFRPGLMLGCHPFFDRISVWMLLQTTGVNRHGVIDGLIMKEGVVAR